MSCKSDFAVISFRKIRTTLPCVYVLVNLSYLQDQDKTRSLPPRKLKPKFERIMKKLRKGFDQWEKYHLDDLETELCFRHRCWT